MINKLCGTFPGPGNFSETYTVNCTKGIMARYIPLQTTGNYTSVAINELDEITEPHVMKGNQSNMIIQYKAEYR